MGRVANQIKIIVPSEGSTSEVSIPTLVQEKTPVPPPLRQAGSEVKLPGVSDSFKTTLGSTQGCSLGGW